MLGASNSSATTTARMPRVGVHPGAGLRRRGRLLSVYFSVKGWGNSVKPIPALKPLAVLAGTWDTVIRWSEETHKLVGGPAQLSGTATFEWMERGKFLHYEFGPSQWIIGRDESSPQYCVLYSDDRGISRFYEMTFSRGVWRIWRDAPSFHQRFEGRITNRGRTIHAHWDRSTDGRKWIRDFDLTYTKTTPSR